MNEKKKSGDNDTNYFQSTPYTDTWSMHTARFWHFNVKCQVSSYLLKLFNIFVMVAALSTLCLNEGGQRVFAKGVFSVNVLENALEYVRNVLRINKDKTALITAVTSTS